MRHHPPARSEPLLLALHSSSATLGVACGPEGQPGEGILQTEPVESPDDPLDQVACFPLGRELSNALPACVSSVVAPAHWPRIVRLAVATGPGGFTGTRLTVVMARTLAQQLSCPLDGVSSFLLMAHRLIAEGHAAGERFWIRQELPRRGFVTGRYETVASGAGVVECESPILVSPEAADAWSGRGEPVHSFQDDVASDVARLLSLAREAHHRGSLAPWSRVLPIYPTSPVGRP